MGDTPLLVNRGYIHSGLTFINKAIHKATQVVAQQLFIFESSVDYCCEEPSAWHLFLAAVPEPPYCLLKPTTKQTPNLYNMLSNMLKQGATALALPALSSQGFSCEVCAYNRGRCLRELLLRKKAHRRAVASTAPHLCWQPDGPCCGPTREICAEHKLRASLRTLPKKYLKRN